MKIHEMEVSDNLLILITGIIVVVGLIFSIFKYRIFKLEQKNQKNYELSYFKLKPEEHESMKSQLTKHYLELLVQDPKFQKWSQEKNII